MRMDEARAKELKLFCVAWGPPGPGPDHMDCPVVVTDLSQVTDQQRGKLDKLPAVCDCDCTTCKRAWWSMGRPMLTDGKIVTETGRVIA